MTKESNKIYEKKKQKKLRAFDLCCGLGGLSLGAFNVGVIPIAAVDLSENALRTYRSNFPQAEVINGDVAEPSVIDKFIEIKSRHEQTTSKFLVISGPPCQGFSVAGRRLAKDARNKVMISVAKAISAIQPDGALVENVASIMSKKHSQTIRQFIKILVNGGYHVCPVELNSLDFGVPQRRRRMIFFITRKPADRKTFENELEKLRRPYKTVGEELRDLPPAVVRDDCYSDVQANQGFFNHFAMQHSEKVKKKIAGLKPGTGPLSYRKLDPAKVAGTLISGHRAPPAHFNEPRSITVREAARLQGFPDDFRVCGKFGAQMQQVTDAVPPPLGHAALKTLLKIIG